ncbi:hypothetical protein JCM16138_09400 [Thermococcus atlanticus]
MDVIGLKPVGFECSDSIQGGDIVSFTVKVKSTYPTGQNAELKLYVDGNAVDTVKGVINANSEKTFNLHWFAHQGEHHYTVKIYSITEEKNSQRTKGKEV